MLKKLFTNVTQRHNIMSLLGVTLTILAYVVGIVIGWSIGAKTNGSKDLIDDDCEQ